MYSKTIAAILSIAISMAAALPVSADIAIGFPVILESVPSVEAQGLGNAGVSWIGPNSHSLNPGSLALQAKKKAITATIYPIKAKWDDGYPDDVNLWHFGVSGVQPIGRDGDKVTTTVGLAYYYHRFNFGTFQRTLEDSPEIVDEIEEYDLTHNVSLGLAFRKKFDVGVGVTFRHFRRQSPAIGAGIEYQEFNATANMIDIGLLARREYDLTERPTSASAFNGWTLTPAVGATVRNLGPKAEYLDPNIEDDLPRSLRVGASVTATSVVDGLPRYTFTPLFEVNRLLFSGSDFTLHYGGEIGILSVVYGRIGRIVYPDGDAAQTTWGVSLSSQGLTDRLLGPPGSEGESSGSFFERTSIQISYASYVKNQPNPLSGIHLFQVAVSVEL